VNRKALAAGVVMLVLLVACGAAQPAVRPNSSPSRPGPEGDSWTWDGSLWHRASGSGPAPRYLAALAYDAQRRVYVLFGGQTLSGSSDETWIWDGTKWTAKSPAHKPPPRRSAAMAYDPAHHVVVLYGGLKPDQSEGSEIGDTWTWDGNDWTQADSGPGPPRERQGLTMVTAGNRVVLFGGRVANVLYYGDAWSWDGKTWQRADDSPRPPGRGSPAVAWDGLDSTFFVFGGAGFNATAGPGAQGMQLDDAWSLSARRWTRLIGSGPGSRAYANAIWDRGRAREVVLLGITCPNLADAAWAWDGKAWSKLAGPGVPARWGAASAETPDGRALLFGGSDEVGC
jgi:hypothetical protein